MLSFDKQVKKLEKLSVKLEAWRNTKKSRTTPIPVDLATAAVALEPFLGKRPIEKKLGVNWSSLSNKLTECSTKKIEKKLMPEFVDLTNLVSEPTNKISIHIPDGTRIEWEFHSDSIVSVMQLCTNIICQKQGV